MYDLESNQVFCDSLMTGLPLAFYGFLFGFQVSYSSSKTGYFGLFSESWGMICAKYSIREAGEGRLGRKSSRSGFTVRATSR